MGAIALHLAVARPDDGVARRMCAAAPHRGERVEALIHGRCAIACVNDSARPDAVIGTDGQLAVAFGGELDNIAELRSDLARDGVDVANEIVFLLAAAYRLYGEDFPSRLRGVFAGAISDGSSVWAFRDHIGYRSLFYRADATGFFAATESKQIIAGAGINREPDLEVLERIYFRTATDDTPTALKGAWRLPKSTGVASDGRNVRLRRYWNPERLLETARLPEEEVHERFTALMDQAVTRSLSGRDAISLSGGIDSPAIAAFAAPRHRDIAGRALQAVSVVYPRYPSVDESEYVRLLADAFDIPLHTYEQSTTALDGLERWATLADTPAPGAALAHYEEDYRVVRTLGIERLLTGEHAEFVAAFQWRTLDHFLSHGRFGAARRQLAERRRRGSSWFGLARLLARSVAPDRVMRLRNALGRSRPATVPSWIDLRRASEEPPIPVRQRWLRSQLAGFIGPGIALEAEEVCQAVCGIRVRRPWTDIDLWEFFLSLPAEQKFPDLRAKGLVRDMLRGRVPDAILDRTKPTVFDEAMLAEMDRGRLRNLLIGTGYAMPGVDYRLLGRRLETGSLTPVEYQWARNLAAVHAFMAQWTARPAASEVH